MTRKPQKPVPAKKKVAAKPDPRKALGNSKAGSAMDKLKQKYKDM